MLELDTAGHDAYFCAEELFVEPLEVSSEERNGTTLNFLVAEEAISFAFEAPLNADQVQTLGDMARLAESATALALLVDICARNWGVHYMYTYL